MARAYTELIRVVRNRVLNQNTTNIISVEFPMAGYYRVTHLRLRCCITHSDGTTPIADGELSILKNLTYKTSNNEMIVNSAHGRGLFRMLASYAKTLPSRTAVAAATADYEANYPIFHSAPDSVRPDDTLLKVDRYQALFMELTIGDITDLLGTPGSDTLVVYCDVAVERLIDDIPVENQPKFYREYKNIPPINPANQQFVDIERANNYGLHRVLLHAADSATLGSPFTGTSSDTTIAVVNFETQVKDVYNDLYWLHLNQINKTFYQWENLQVGFILYDFVNGGSIMESLFTGPYSILRATWTNGVLSTSQISGMAAGIRNLV